MGVTVLILLIYCDGDEKTPYQKGPVIPYSALSSTSRLSSVSPI